MRSRGRAAGSKAILSVVAVLLALGATAVAQTGPTLKVEPAEAAPGDTVEAAGSGFQATRPVALYLDKVVPGEELANGETSAKGTFSLEFSVPAAPAGRHTVIGCRDPDGRGGCREQATAPLRIVEPPTTTTPTTRPRRDTTTTSTTNGLGVSTTATTAPPPGNLAGSTTTTLPGQIAGPSTTLGGDPPAPSGPGGVAIETTTTQPPLAGSTVANDLFAYRIEVTQGIQNFDHHLPMLPLRPTYARVYIAAGKGAIPGVRGFLAGYHNGKLLTIESAINQPLTAVKNGKPRVELASSLLFRVPEKWTLRSLDLFAFVYYGDIDTTLDQDPDIDNNFHDVSVDFHDEPVTLPVMFAPLHLHQFYLPSTPENTWFAGDHAQDFVQIVNGLERVLPVSSITPYVLGNAIYPAEHDEGFGPEWDIDEDSADESGKSFEPLTQLLLYKLNNIEPLNSWSWYGMLPPLSNLNFWSTTGNVAISYGGLSNGAVSMGMMNNQFEADVPFEIRGSKTIAHEFGHDNGLDHYSCVLTDDPDDGDLTTEALGGSLDPDWPHPAPDCHLAIVDPQGYYGLDVHYESFDYLDQPSVIANDFDAFPKGQRAWPLMSYGPDLWIDPFSWCRMLVSYGVPCNAYPPGDVGVPGPTGVQSGMGEVELGAVDRIASHRRLGPSASVAPASANRLMVAAYADPAASGGRLFEVAMVDDVPDSSVQQSADRLADMAKLSDGSVALVVVDSGGDELARHPLADLAASRRHDGPASGFAVVELLPVPDGAAGVRLVVGDDAVAERLASPSAPTVRVIEPVAGTDADGEVTVRWEATDADGDALRFDLHHSTDGGRTWQTIARQVTGTSHVVPAGTLTGSTRSRIRVIAHDGFRTAAAESDVFETPDTGPRPVLIMSPSDGATFARRQLVALRGRAVDAEDGIVTKLRWHSDRDGDLGTGASVQTRELSAGTHVVTLTATDSAGNAAKATITIEVDGSTEADAPDDATLARGLDLINDHRDSGDGGIGLPLVVVMVLGAVAVLVTPLILRRRRRRAAGVN